MLKRIFDIVATICGGILISPILLAIAIWVYHDSPGPVIFKHRRVGKNGKEFNCYKFRSMCVNSKEVLEHLLATDPAAKAEWDKEFKLKDCALSTSGNTLQYNRHIINPLSGIYNGERKASTVLSPDPLEAEILSTVWMIADHRQREHIAKNFKDIQATLYDL